MDCAYQKFTTTEMSDAQWALDHYPSNSSYWDSFTAQDHLEVIVDLNLQPNTTEQWRRTWHHEQMNRSALEDHND